MLFIRYYSKGQRKNLYRCFDQLNDYKKLTWLIVRNAFSSFIFISLVYSFPIVTYTFFRKGEGQLRYLSSNRKEIRPSDMTTNVN